MHVYTCDYKNFLPYTPIIKHKIMTTVQDLDFLISFYKNKTVNQMKRIIDLARRSLPLMRWRRCRVHPLALA